MSIDYDAFRPEPEVALPAEAAEVVEPAPAVALRGLTDVTEVIRVSPYWPNCSVLDISCWAVLMISTLFW
jgi:hypothetical protein